MSFTAALNDALRVPHPHESEAKVHELLASRLTTLTPGASVKLTGYYNHSWAPDFVVVGGVSVERPVYLRFGTRDASFGDDLRLLGERAPVFVDLVSPAPGVAEKPQDLPVGDSLVTDAEAIGTLETSVSKDSQVRSATGRVVLGGHGWVDDERATEIVTHWNEASEAAASANADELRETLDEFDKILNASAALDLESDLRAKWASAGHDIELFPNSADWDLRNRSTAEIARLAAALLGSENAVPAEQWQAIAQAVSASDLGHAMYQSESYRHGAKVNALVVEALEHWTAKSAYVRPVDDDDQAPPFEWSLGSYSLAIKLGRRRAYFTDKPNKWNRVQRTDALPTLGSRMKAIKAANVVGAGIVTSEETAAHELAPTATQTMGERLEHLTSSDGDPAWSAATLSSLDLKVPGTSAVAHIDYSRSIVRTSDAIPLKTFVMLCAHYVDSLEDEEIEALNKSLTGELGDESD